MAQLYKLPKQPMPAFVLNARHVPVVAIVSVKSPSDEEQLLKRLKKHDPRVRSTDTLRYGRAIITKLPLSSDYPSDTCNQINFHIPSILMDGNRIRSDVVFQINLWERGGRKGGRNFNNFAQIICANDGSKIRALGTKGEEEKYGASAIFGVRKAVVIVANMDGVVSINHVFMNVVGRTVSVGKISRKPIHYKDEVPPSKFVEAAIAAVKRVHCKGCKQNHFCITYNR